MILKSKILTEVTLDANKTFTVYIDNVGAYDTKVQATISSGTYFVAWDMQSDDFIYEVMNAVYTALDASAVAAYNGSDSDGKLLIAIDSDGKVNLAVGNGLDMRIAWTEDDTAEIGDILGFDTSADLDIESGAVKTARDQHAYAWYADELGLISLYHVEDHNVTSAIQKMSLGGVARTQYLDDRYVNELALRMVNSARMFSAGASYEAAPVYPYARNVPLECWWNEARQGLRFRVYEEGYLHSDTADVKSRAVAGTAIDAASTTTTVVDATLSLDTNPQEHDGKLLIVPSFFPANQATFDAAHPFQRWYISSHTATTFTLPNSLMAIQFDTNASEAYVADQRYRTYQVDLNSMDRFAPVRPSDGVSRYDLRVPLIKYQS